MKKLLFLPILLLVAAFKADDHPGFTYPDDTAALQARIDSGNYTCPAGHGIYYVTSLSLHHNLNLNGNRISCSGTNGGCLVFPMGYASRKLSNGEIYGTTDICNAFGASGIRVLSDADSLVNVRVHRFAAYGVFANNINGLVMLNSKLYDTGYIGMFVINNGLPSSRGPVCMTDTFDRSMLPPTGLQAITEGCLQVRGAAGDTVSGTVIYNCQFLGAYKASDATAESVELRFCDHASISKSGFSNSTIGASVVGCNDVVVDGCTFTGQSLEAGELANSIHCVFENCNIGNQAALGILFDTNAQYNNLLNDNIRGCPAGCVQLSAGSNYNNITSCTLTATPSGYAIHLVGANHLVLCGDYLVGPSSARAIQSDNGTGDIRLYGGTISGFNRAIGLYGNMAITINNLYMVGVSMVGTPPGLYKIFSGGAALGANIIVN